MTKMTRSVVTALSFSLLPAIPLQAQAASNTFDHSTFSISYVFGTGSASDPWETVAVTGNATSIELADFWYWEIDATGNTLSLTWLKERDYMNDPSIAPFIGIRISDTNGQLADITGVSIANSTYVPSTYGNLIEGFGPSNLAFDADNVYINLNTSMWHNFEPEPGKMGDRYRDRIALEVSFQAAPIPEPETWAMLLAGLGLLGGLGRRTSIFPRHHA
ncbi:PEP-CTERM sorting domain-containing protein [Nitrosovibrio sp. Nv17]|uniref:PEP-CTERM sorting domain-containing protein n=1 Tax=Nitrosovibrio sp. Nv17 TaxID=1855339 RepID=UPI000908D604|nr:PEP-CTERM sorting domain-containing protein [Nitrosovibrio sp. Nv17]SFW16222.1 PEP-CTERM protein-sorting domain-containing protein/MYXO-CTERM domain-containing protein [Nitrosovibrio sp. Nv17]